VTSVLIRRGSSRTVTFEEAEPNFADDASSAPGWRDAAVDYHKYLGVRVSVTSYTADQRARLRELIAGNVALERAWHEINHPTDRAAASMVDALMLGLRQRGTTALAEGAVRQRLAQLDEEQIAEVAARLRQLEPHIARVWTADETQQLIAKWGELHRD
jgi:hypothetical protein